MVWQGSTAYWNPYRFLSFPLTLNTLVFARKALSATPGLAPGRLGTCQDFSCDFCLKILGHAPATFRKKFRKDRKRSQSPSRVWLGTHNSRRLKPPEHLQSSLPLRTVGDASLFRSDSGLSELGVDSQRYRGCTNFMGQGP